MSEPPPQPPELPSGPPSSPPPLPPAAAAYPGYPAYVPPPTARRSLASRPMFWILLVFAILAFFAVLAAGGFRGYSKIIKGVKEKQAKQEALAELEQLQKEQQQSMRQELDETGTISNNQGHLEKLQEVLEKSGKGTDEDAATARAAATWTRKVGEASKLFTEASARLNDPPVMDASSLKSKEDVASRRILVQEFMAANLQLMEVFRNSERDFATFLRAEGVPQARVSPMAKGFITSLRNKLPVIQKIRDMDAAYASLLLKWLDLIETEWGSWALENGELTFSRPEEEETHRKLAADIEQTGTDQAEAQRQLVELQEKGP